MLTTETRLGPYEIVSHLGSGGMGEVYKARDTRLDRTVAIKVLAAHHWENPTVKKRFEREARAISQLSHSHICALYDIGEVDVESIGAIVRETSPVAATAGKISYLVMNNKNALQEVVEAQGHLIDSHIMNFPIVYHLCYW